MSEEWLDVVDDEGNPTGERVLREEAHRDGIQHRTAHVWLYRIRFGKIQILLQKRSENKDSFPGCYDISSAGHIPAGQEYYESALRELKEELGVEAEASELHPCGMRRISFDDVFHGQPFHDRQVTQVFVLRRDEDEEAFQIQEDELSEVRWVNLDSCMKDVQTGSFPNCIYPEELKMVKTGIFDKEFTR